jgi:hypothetical protein
MAFDNNECVMDCSVTACHQEQQRTLQSVMQLFQKHHLNFKTVSRNLLVVVLYVLLAKIGLFFALKPTTITIFWPAGGFALAVLLLGGCPRMSAKS